MTGLLIGFVIGLTLGLLGGGGSILTVPALVYLVGQSPQVAVTTSLAVVGTNSAIGAYFHRNQGTLNWRVALLFGGAGIGMAYLSAGLSQHFAKPLLLTIFACLMLTIGLLMTFAPRPATVAKKEMNWIVIVVSGAGVGLLTGLLGVGGGFLIVPALVMLVGLPFQQAVGTSLVVIAMNSFAGFMGHLSHVSLDIGLMMTFIASGFAGTFVGAHYANRIRADHLRQAFALFVIGLAIVLLYDNLPNLL
ncbi:MAG: sulfite exporter TauE/SafE family protein [Chloroflexi bacterium]|nr:sulfite exporter TauE/SafE family protein [Chloroflexota bacterium]